MTLVPSETPGEALVQRTVVKPIDPFDPPSTWRKFLDTLRMTVGLKPLHLALRFGEARVAKEEAEAKNCEIDGQLRLMQGRMEYERALAEIRDRELAARGKFEKDTAEAAFIRVKTQEVNIAMLKDSIEKLSEASSLTPDENAEWLQNVIQRITFHGGSVEIVAEEDCEVDDQQQDPDESSPST